MSENINDLLDMSIDDLADMPEFKPFPAGSHRAIITLTNKVINGVKSIEIKMKGIETIELNDPLDTPLTAGEETSVLYQLNNNFAQGKLKPILVAIGNHFKIGKLGEIIEAAQNLEAIIVTKVRANKEKTQNYTELVAVFLD